MTSLTSTGTELRRFRHGLLPKLAIAAMVLVPLLYGALYLWAFWDPTGHLDRLPVALVNADAGAVRDGAPVHAGDQVTTALVDSKALKWVRTDAGDAATGVRDGRYYFALTVPADFSASVVSAGGTDPHPAQLQVTYDDTNSFLATTLGRSAMAQVSDAVRATIGQQAADQVLVGLGSARDGFARASDGALTLQAAAGTLSSGAHQVASGADAAAGGAASLAAGSSAAASGSATLDKGAHALADGTATLATGAQATASGARTLADGAARLADGSASAATSATALATGAAQVSAGVTTTAGQVSALATQLGDLSTGLTSVMTYLAGRAPVDPTAAALLTGMQKDAAALPSAAQLAQTTDQLSQLRTGATKVAGGAAQLSSGLGTLSTSASRLSSGAAALAGGTAQVSGGAVSAAAGAHDLAAGADQLAAGTATLATGATTLAGGTSALASGASRVAAGSDQLGAGSATLAGALRTGASSIPTDDPGTQTARAATLSTPVRVTSTDVHAAAGFGEGFAPFFIPLALFVGSLITWLLLRPLPSRALATPASGWRATFAGFLPAMVIGVAQVAVMLAVIHWGVGLQPASAVGTVAFTLLVVAAFLALQQMLVAVLGPAGGKVAVLALLMLQLASSGGTYPVQTTPAFFQAVHPWLPMSYAVSGLREVITGGADGRLLVAVLVLVGVLVGSLAITAWRAGRMRTWTLSRLHPVLSI